MNYKIIACYVKMVKAKKEKMALEQMKGKNIKKKVRKR